jgi:DNA-binding response OmpR family regulator
MLPAEKCPVVIVAHADPVYAAQVCRMFRRLGWDVCQAQSGPEVRRLARIHEPRFIVLDTLLPNESGWLTCDKVRLEFPEVHVVLVAVEPGFHEANFAAFVGAAGMVDRADGVQALLDEIEAVAV